jgi:fumarylacetoacetase
VTTSWIPVPAESDFPVENLPFGIVRGVGDAAPRVALRIGNHVVDLAALVERRLVDVPPELVAAPTLNALLADEGGHAGRVRGQVAELLTSTPDARVEPAIHPVESVACLLPIHPGDFVDHYSSLDHATNLGRLLRPGSEPLLPNWRRLPVGYHGRSGSVIVSGTDVVRPAGLLPCDGSEPALAPSAALDIELEVGFVVGAPGTRIAPDDAADHIFGAVLLNDWSARDIQAYEYQPLGPNLGKSFATTVSPWVVTLDALRPYLVPPPPQDPEPDPYLRAERPWALDLQLEIWLNGERVSATNFRTMYWTFAQQLAPMTVNGAVARPGDLIGSGTVSGPARAERGSLIELTWQGADPLTLADGSHRAFLLDGDTVALHGWCGGAPPRPRIGFGAAVGTIVPAIPRARPIHDR